MAGGLPASRRHGPPPRRVSGSCTPDLLWATRRPSGMPPSPPPARAPRQRGSDKHRPLCAAWAGQLRCDLSCPGHRRSLLLTEALKKFLRALASLALPSMMKRALRCPLADSGLEAGTLGHGDWVVVDASLVGRSLGWGGP